MKKKYVIIEPEDVYTIVFEGWALDDMAEYRGSTPTGRTNCFQAGIPPHEKVNVPFATF